MYKPLIVDASKKYGNNRWVAFSHKINRMVYLFSDLEYEHWLLIESDANVVAFCEQPLKMEVLGDNKKSASIVDMWVRYKDGQETFIEVKYSKDLSKESVVKQINVQQLWCKANNISHEVRNERNIRSNPILLSNLKVLIKQANSRLNNNQMEIMQIEHHIGEEHQQIQHIAINLKLEYSKVFSCICKLLH
ncbi:TnsA endonuclease N-terminal domain-containing protein [Psychrobacillus sp. L4]|uniref:TnsA endonuclease N-terminal domain-containing protein n=1 Tax=Psychrobacillus sp. L4 TaxID=3236892 RepID=UPI0036F34A48